MSENSSTNEPSSTATSTSSTEPQAENLKQRKVTRKKRVEVTQALYSLYPHVVSGCCSALEFLVTREKSESMSRQPLGQFCSEQVILAIQEFIYLTQRKLISYRDVRDMVDNLTALLERVIAAQPDVAVKMGSLLKSFVTTINELSTHMETLADVNVTNWSAVATKIEENVKGFSSIAIRPFTFFIPPISHIKEIRLLGAGGFGSVYKATFLPAGLVCSVKIVPSDRFQQSKHAAIDKIVASVTGSPFVVRYYICFSANIAYITLMEYIPGVDLNRVVDRLGIVELNLSRLLIAQMYRGIEHLHVRGFLHRDIKISNCLIIPRGRLKLIDFDTNKCCLGHFTKKVLRGYFRRTSFEFWDFESAGTLPYMAPEELDLKPYGRSVDWWSLGVTAFKLTTGTLPFRSDDRDDLKLRILKLKHSWPDSDLTTANKACQDFTDSLLKKNPRERLGSRLYIDIKCHSFFNSVDWKTLATASKICDIPSIREAMCPHNVRDIPTDDLSPEASEGSIYRCTLGLSDLGDIEKDKAVPLFTYAAPVFRKLIERYTKDRTPFVVEKQELETDLAISADIDYEDKLEKKSITALTITKMVIPKGASELRTMDIIIHRSTKNSSCVFLLSFGFKYIRVPGMASSRNYIFVTKIESDSPASNSSLQVNDIIIAIQNVKISLLDDSQIRWLLRAASDKLTVQIILSSPFRTLSNPEVSKQEYELLCNLKEAVNIELNKSRNFFGCIGASQGVGLETVTLTLPSTDSKKSVKVYLVKRALSYCRVISPRGASLFCGDMITQINGMNVSSKSQQELDEAVNKMVPLKLSAIFCSPIRNIVENKI